MDDNDAIRGQLDSIILRSLLDKDEYGLEVYNNIKLLDNVMGEIKQSTFYNALKRLENASLISSYEGDISKGAKRIYYSITPNGRRYLLDEYRRWDIDSDTETDLFDDNDDIDDNLYKKRKRTRRSKSALNPENNTADIAPSTEIKNAETAYTDTSVDDMDKNEIVEPRYTSEIKLNTIIGGKYPPKSEPQPKNEEPDNRSAAEILFDDNENDTASESRNIAAFTLLGGIDDNRTIEEKKARLNDILSMNFNSDDSKSTSSNITESVIDSALNSDSAASIADKNENVEKEHNINENITKAEAKFYNKSNEIVNKSDTPVYKSENNADTSAVDAKTNAPQKEILNKPYVESISVIQSESTENVNYIDSLAGIYKKENAETLEYTENPRRNPSVEITRLNTLNYDDYDEEKFKETSLNKLKQRLALENIRLKQYVKSNTTSFYIGKYYYSSKLLRDASIITYIVFLSLCIAAHFIANATHTADTALTVVFSLLGAVYPAIACAKWQVMPAKRKRLPLNISMMFIASLLIYVLTIVIIVIVAFFCFKVNVAAPSSTITPLVLPIVISAIVPLGVLIYALLFRSGRYNLK